MKPVEEYNLKNQHLKEKYRDQTLTNNITYLTLYYH
jgi:hypothetical protein